MKATYTAIAMSALFLAGCQSTSEPTETDRLSQSIEMATTEQDILNAFVSVYGGQIKETDNLLYAELPFIFLGNFYRAMDRQCGGNLEPIKLYDSHQFSGLKHMKKLKDIAKQYSKSTTLIKYGYLTKGMIQEIVNKSEAKTPEQLGAMLLGLSSATLTTDRSLGIELKSHLTLSNNERFSSPIPAEPYACVDSNDTVRNIISVYGLWDSSTDTGTKLFLAVTKKGAIERFTSAMYKRMERHGRDEGARSHAYISNDHVGELVGARFKFSTGYTNLKAGIALKNKTSQPIKLPGRQLVESVFEEGQRYEPVYIGRYNPSLSGKGCAYLAEEDKILVNPNANCSTNLTYKVPGLGMPKGDDVTVSINGHQVVLNNQTELNYLINYKHLDSYF